MSRAEAVRFRQCTQEAPEILQQHYGLQLRSLDKLDRGSAHGVLKLDTSSGRFVLKWYDPDIADLDTLTRTLRGNQQAERHGIPVAPAIPNVNNELVTPVARGWYVLYRHIEGRLLDEGLFNQRSAQSFGATIGMLQTAMAELDERDLVGDFNWEMRVDWGYRYLQGKLETAESSADPRAQIAAAAIRRHLETFVSCTEAMASVERLPVQWVHGDCNPGNFLFASDDTVAAVLDFDNVSRFPQGYDFMYGLNQSFRDSRPLVSQSLSAYLSQTKPVRQDVVAYPSMWLYCSMLNMYPMDNQDATPEDYQKHWDDYRADVGWWVSRIDEMSRFFGAVYDEWLRKQPPAAQ